MVTKQRLDHISPIRRSHGPSNYRWTLQRQLDSTFHSPSEHIYFFSPRIDTSLDQEYAQITTSGPRRPLPTSLREPGSTPLVLGRDTRPPPRPQTLPLRLPQSLTTSHASPGNNHSTSNLRLRPRLRPPPTTKHSNQHAPPLLHLNPTPAPPLPLRLLQHRRRLLRPRRPLNDEHAHLPPPVDPAPRPRALHRLLPHQPPTILPRPLRTRQLHASLQRRDRTALVKSLPTTRRTHTVAAALSAQAIESVPEAGKSRGLGRQGVHV